ncbi:IST3 family RNA-binding protein [Sporobolomyces koalae]|uniref:IST3 family RNA-binding protein n=1 Tax=Sporobolomyces koalae TaxID=500713 RepID=UPI00317740E0
MNQIQQIQRINQQELDSGATVSWHDQYKDSAYINVGGLPYNLTEGDVITIFSQYGEVLDINMPRDKTTGKVRGFAWLMYSDQRSTVLAVDNLNGATILGRMIRVDHVLNYKQLEHDEETGKMKEREQESFAADPRNFIGKKDDGNDSDTPSEQSLPPNFDPEDPMAEYILAQHREGSQRRKAKGKSLSEQDKEDKRRRKEERRVKREERDRKKARIGDGGRSRERDSKRDSSSRRDPRSRSRSPDRSRRRIEDEREHERDRLGRRDEGDSRSKRRRDDDPRDYSDDEGSRRRDPASSSRRDHRGGDQGGRGSSFADLEKWARG